MTSFEVKLSVVPGWKWSGQIMADCFEVSVGNDMVASLSGVADRYEGTLLNDIGGLGESRDDFENEQMVLSSFPLH